MIPSSELHNHLCEGFQEYLPDEMQEQQQGRAKTTDIVRDYIKYCQHVEELDDILALSSNGDDAIMEGLLSSSLEVETGW